MAEADEAPEPEADSEATPEPEPVAEAEEDLVPEDLVVEAALDEFEKVVAVVTPEVAAEVVELTAAEVVAAAEVVSAEVELAA